ncbi:hypothetical protein [Oribacterium sp. P6A1]|uniref:hypothetical protein n=1 Tax=Oribacterium sp. P6A1 TaxID=1410612 RepID=UPI00055F1B6B|nr:hypothetical protein [Oribacterium sp. P6A1]
MLTDIIGFILSGVMLIFMVSFVLLGYALFRNKTDLISLCRKAMIFSFAAFALAVTVLQLVFMS